MAQIGPSKHSVLTVKFCSGCIFFKKTLLRESPRPLYEKRCMHESNGPEGKEAISEIFAPFDNHSDSPDYMPEWCSVPGQGDKRTLIGLTKAEKLMSAKLLGGVSHLSDEAIVHQIDELIARIHNMQTNIPGAGWIRVTLYWRAIGIDLEEFNTQP